MFFFQCFLDISVQKKFLKYAFLNLKKTLKIISSNTGAELEFCFVYGTVCGHAQSATELQQQVSSGTTLALH